MNIVGFQRKPVDTKSCMSVFLWQVMIKTDDLHLPFLWSVVGKSIQTASVLGLVTIYPS